ncbi:hypothetical protein C1646_762655 [Rhizophagus diaphanus]|nr:hypothetical protein C1646_762655 [Rhizophagus diaphanus] [Rhizophagus sp. MUCL 43196]
MADKFHISPKRVYKIWDNKEHLQQGVIPFFSSQLVLDENFQTNKIEQTKTEKKIYNVEVKPNKSTDLASEGSVILGDKTKKTGEKKLKSVLALLTSSSIQTQPIQALKKDINNVNLDASYEKIVEKSTKIIDVKKKCYSENNLPIS